MLLVGWVSLDPFFLFLISPDFFFLSSDNVPTIPGNLVECLLLHHQKSWALGRGMTLKNKCLFLNVLFLHFQTLPRPPSELPLDQSDGSKLFSWQRKHHTTAVEAAFCQATS